MPVSRHLGKTLPKTTALVLCQVEPQVAVRMSSWEVTGLAFRLQLEFSGFAGSRLGNFMGVFGGLGEKVCNYSSPTPRPASWAWSPGPCSAHSRRSPQRVCTRGVPGVPTPRAFRRGSLECLQTAFRRVYCPPTEAKRVPPRIARVATPQSAASMSA